MISWFFIFAIVWNILVSRFVDFIRKKKLLFTIFRLRKCSSSMCSCSSCSSIKLDLFDYLCRSYYRCTHQGCIVKKQVQRLSKDEEIVVTTYDGIHTHRVDENSAGNFEEVLRHI